VTVGVRPEDMKLVTEGQGLKTVVNVVEELGADAYVFGTAEVNGEEHDIIARVDGRKPPGKGDAVYFAPAEGHLHLFSTKTGERLID
jgi:multiple sugar transport system ATP-binding protein